MRQIPDQMVAATLFASGLVVVGAQILEAPQGVPGPQQVLPLMLGVTLILATWLRALRLPAALVSAVAAGLQTLLAWVARGAPSPMDVALALVLGVLAWQLWREARREARWNGMVPLRPEAW